MSSILQDILRQKLLEIQSGLPAYVKIVKDSSTNFDNVLSSEVAQSSAANSSAGSFDSSNYDSIINEAAKKYNLNSNVIKAVIQAESGFDPNAVSPVGAMGLMQLMPDTAAGLGVKNAFDPQENIDGGTRFLKNQLINFGGDLELALAAYNAGPANVKKYGGIPPFDETQNYVANIMSSLKK